MSERANRGERKMKLKTKLLGGFAALALMAGSAHAGITINVDSSLPGTGALKNFRVVGFNPTPDATGIGGNGGKGALVGLVVVPHTAGPIEANVLLNVAADKGIAYQFAFPLPVPEPTTMGLVGLGAVGLLA